MASKKKYDKEDGVWRTIGGRRVFIRTGQSLSSAMKESGKFKNKKSLASIEEEYQGNRRRVLDERQEAFRNMSSAERKYGDLSEESKKFRQEYNQKSDELAQLDAKRRLDKHTEIRKEMNVDMYNESGLHIKEEQFDRLKEVGNINRNQADYDYANLIRENKMNKEKSYVGDLDIYSVGEYGKGTYIQFQDGKKYNHNLNSPESAKVESNTWARVWEGNENTLNINDSKYGARKQVIDYLENKKVSQDDELSRISGGAISTLKRDVPQNKKDRLKVGTEIYYKGDQANTPGYFTIESYEPDKEQFMSSLTLKEKGGEGRTKKIGAQQIEDSYTNNYASRFSFKEDYDNYRNQVYENYRKIAENKKNEENRGKYNALEEIEKKYGKEERNKAEIALANIENQKVKQKQYEEKYDTIIHDDGYAESVPKNPYNSKAYAKELSQVYNAEEEYDDKITPKYIQDIDSARYGNMSDEDAIKEWIDGGADIIYADDARQKLKEWGVKVKNDDPYETYKNELAKQLLPIYKEDKRVLGLKQRFKGTYEDLKDNTNMSEAEILEFLKKLQNK